MYLEPPEPFLQTSLIKVEEHKISCREEPTEPPKQVFFSDFPMKSKRESNGKGLLSLLSQLPKIPHQE